MGEYDLPDGHDQYFTHIKTKYVSGIRSSSSYKSVGTDGIAINSTTSYQGIVSDTGAGPGKLPCDAVWQILASSGTKFLIPLYKKGSR